MKEIRLAEQPLLVAVLAAFGLWLLLQLLSQALWVIVMVIVALILAAVMMPIVRFVRQWRFPPGGWRLPRAAVVLLIYVLLGGVLALLGYLSGSRLLEDAAGLLRQGPELAEDLVRQVERTARAVGLAGLVPPPEAMAQRAEAAAAGLLGTAGDFVGGLLEFLFRLLITLILALFLVVEAERFVTFVVSLFPPADRSRVREVTELVGHKVARWLLGFVVRGVIIGVLAYVAALLLGLPYPTLVAAMTALLAFLPVVGPIFMVPVVFLLGLGISGGTALLAALVFLVLEQVDAHVLGPLVMGRVIDISPALIIIAIVLGLALYGPVGALISVPALAAVQVLVSEVLLPWLHARQGDPAVGSGGDGRAAAGGTLPRAR